MVASVSVSLSAGGGEHHFLGAGLEVGAYFLAGAESAGGFHHYVYVFLSPGDVGNVGFSVEIDFLAVDYNGVFAFGVYFAFEASVNRIVFDEMYQNFGFCINIKGNHLHFGAFHKISEHDAADSSETADADSDFFHNS